MDYSAAFLVVALLMAIYLVPTFAVIRRGTKYPGPAIVINIFLGWTVLGWVIALALAYAGPKSEEAELKETQARLARAQKRQSQATLAEQAKESPAPQAVSESERRMLADPFLPFRKKRTNVE